MQMESGGARAVLADHPLAFGAEPEGGAVEGALLDAARCAQTLTFDRAAETRSLMSVYERGEEMKSMVDLVTKLSSPGVRS